MKERGITIVSLVITIIILLIISGVTIDALTGKYGIIGMTVKTKRKAEISSERENIKLAVIQTMQDDQNLKSEKNKLEQNLTKVIGKNETALREDANGYLVKIIKTKRYYSIREDGEVEFVGDASDVEKNMQNIELGDNLLNLAELKNNTYISYANGSECESSGWSSSDYIYVGDYKNILIVSDNSSFLDRYNALYNENKELTRVIGISKMKITNDILGQINISISVLKLKENEKYIRISQQNSVIEHIKIYPILNEDFNNVIEFDINRSLIDEYSYGENIFENGKIIKNTYIDAKNGNEIKYNSWDSTDFINVEGHPRVVISYDGTSPVNSYSAMYDSEKKYVSKISVDVSTIDLEKGKIVILKIPENVKYIRLSKNSGTLDNIKVFPIEDKKLTNYTNQNIKIEDSIIKSENIIEDYYIETNGKDVSYNGWSETDYLDLSKYKSVLVIGNDNVYNAIYDKDKNFIRTLNFSGSTLYNSKIGDVGAEISYIKVIDAFKYIRLSNGTSKIKNVKIYPITNEDFNKHFIFNISK